MKILFVHNFYSNRAPSGENVCVNDEISLLKSKGFDVEVFKIHSDKFLKSRFFAYLFSFIFSAINPFQIFKYLKKIHSFNPDIVHIHNTFPFISSAIIWFTPKKIKVIQTLHNYRITCATGTLLRNNKIHTACIETKNPLSCLNYNCYKDNFFATLPIALSNLIHKRFHTWNRVDKFIVLSNFQKSLMSGWGIKEEKIHVKPNFLNTKLQVKPVNFQSKSIVFVGRLSEEKGIKLLRNSWLKYSQSNAYIQLKIIGDGPLLGELDSLPNTKLYGLLDREEVINEIQKSQFLIMPSIWHETFGLAMVESFSQATPVIASNISPINEIVKDGINGYLFEPNEDDLLKTLKTKIINNPKYGVLSKNALTDFKSKYSSDAHFININKIYKGDNEELINSVKS